MKRQNLRIVVLEDDDSSREVLTRVLERRSYEVVSAREPLLCPLYTDLNAVCTHQFPCGDFLLTDNHMPRMSGLEFVTRQCRRGCKGVVHRKAVISGAWDEEDLSLARELGCKIFTKPYRLAEIFQWLEGQARQIPFDRKLTPLLPD